VASPVAFYIRIGAMKKRTVEQTTQEKLKNQFLLLKGREMQ
jgi:hypothetical protein